MSEAGNASGTPLFRVAKRRKVTHRRPGVRDDDDDDLTRSTPEASISNPPNAPTGALDEAGDGSVAALDQTDVADQDTSVAELLRRRKLGKARRAGIEFTSDTMPHRVRMDNESDVELRESGVVSEQRRSAIDAATNRFAPQTGQVVDQLDKHM